LPVGGYASKWGRAKKKAIAPIIPNNFEGGKMENAEVAILFEKAVKEGKFDSIVRKYKDKIDAKAVSILSNAMCDLWIEKQSAEKVNEKLADQMKEYILPRGKLTIPEYMDLIQSVGNIFKTYTNYKKQTIAKNIENANQPTKNNSDKKTEGKMEKKWWEIWK